MKLVPKASKTSSEQDIPSEILLSFNELITSKFFYVLEKCDKRQKIPGRPKEALLLKVMRLAQVK